MKLYHLFAAFALLTSQFSIANAGINDGLLVHYPLDGNADELISGFDGTVYGATPVEDRFGIPNSAFQFDGIDDYISTTFGNGVDYPNGISIQVWAKLSDPGDGVTVGSRGTYQEFTGIAVQGSGAYTGRAHMYVSQTEAPESPKVISDIIIDDTEWHHILGTYDGSSLSVYVDGIGKTVSASVDTYSANDFELGRDTFHDYYMRSAIDDVKIWDRALSSSEVASLVPEPSTLVLFGLSTVALLTRRRHS